MAILDDISSALQRGKRKEIGPLVQQALDEGTSAQTILDILIDGMGIVGDKFSRNEIYVPEMLIAARAMSTATDILKPLLAEEGSEPRGKAVIGTVHGDMHDIGKNLVRMMVEGKGFEIVDLGVDVSVDTFLDYLREHDDTKLVLLSALLTTTMPSMEETVKAIDEAGLHAGRKIMVGGAPITSEFAEKIGADAYTADAGSAADKAVELAS
jgi:methanogenic corrinoid protein MtbC1